MADAPPFNVAVVVPTLEAGENLTRCLDSLARQSYSRFHVIVVDNSGAGIARTICSGRPDVTYLANERNQGFGAAVNRGFRASGAPLLATINDDAEAEPGWLDALSHAVESDQRAGMCASMVRFEDDVIDSAGMLIASDGSTKQRGHGARCEDFDTPCEVLFPSGSAALYRREMLEQTGYFDDDFFLYCEDSDLGLRGRWAGWRCLYVPRARVRHGYSRTAGRASAQKAYYVERNRLRLVTKNFPLSQLLTSFLSSWVRYGWHAWYALRGQGKAAEFAHAGNAWWRLGWFVLRAHASLAAALPGLLRQRRGIQRSISATCFKRLLKTHSISLREVAAL
ncbi:MAG: glycosyltransferase family 2 protein [Bryobacterales bacterium]|nr:glycosyltransferase family 2 protein [Bryobacterales bacterium]